MKTSYILILSISILTNSAFAQDAAIDEAALFADSSSITADTVMSTVVDQQLDKKSVSLSGQLTAAAVVSVSRKGVEEQLLKEVGLTTATVGNIMLDIRLPGNIKAFADLQAAYVPNNNTMIVGLQEIFIDANINHQVYLRVGKQVLQWGRCYFFNPTDLINIEKKLLYSKVGTREGAFGLKMHVPFGTVANIYGFLDTRNVTSPESLSGAIKVEGLLGNTEMALMAWGKQGYNIVYGFDISTKVLGVDISGELGMSQGDNYDLLDIIRDSIMTTTRKGCWTPRAAIGVSRAFDCLDVSDRISTVVEFYYNHAGYDENGFADQKQYLGLRVPSLVHLPTGQMIPIEKDSLMTRSAYLSAKNLYRANDYSRYYLAYFVSLAKFIMSDMTLSCNGIINIPQSSAMLTAGISYVNMHGFSVGLTLIGYAGAKNTEYTFNGKAITTQLTAGLTF